MTPKEAADKLRPNFTPDLTPHDTPPEDRHHVKFLEDVAIELGVEPTPFVLHQLREAMEEGDIRPDSNEYPKMMFSRSHPENGHPGTYDARHDHVHAIVANEEEAAALGSGWVDSIHDLPPRGDIPVHLPASAPRKTEPAHAPEVHPHNELGSSI